MASSRGLAIAKIGTPVLKLFVHTKIRYLRKRWYAQEKRAAAPIVCIYLGRSDNKSKRPFRFILNHSKATAANVLYPTPAMQQAIRVSIA